jgi:3-hydroxyisobutyrate dehydrogenase
MRIAILGLGEAGGRYGADLAAAGIPVTGYDPAPVADPPGVRRAGSIAAAVTGADLVLGFTGAEHAVPAATEAAAALGPGACYADLNAAAPAVKYSVAGALRSCGARVADVAVLAPVPRGGAATPLLVCGPGSSTVVGAFRPLGADVEILDEPVGAAAARKLLRSVFMKGLAAAVLEAVTAGAAAGCEDWVRDQIAAELGPDGRALVDRLVTGTRAHAHRRVGEVEAARAYLADLDVPTAVADATLAWLRALDQ